MHGQPLTYKATSGEADYRALLKVGMSPRQAEFITGPGAIDDADAIQRYRHQFTRHQFTALADAPTMATLLKAKFTRHQAKVLTAPAEGPWRRDEPNGWADDSDLYGYAVAWPGGNWVMPDQPAAEGLAFWRADPSSSPLDIPSLGDYSGIGGTSASWDGSEWGFFVGDAVAAGKYLVVVYQPVGTAHVPPLLPDGASFTEP